MRSEVVLRGVGGRLRWGGGGGEMPIKGEGEGERLESLVLKGIGVWRDEEGYNKGSSPQRRGNSGKAPTRCTLATRDIHHICRQGIHPLALLGIFAVITEVDGSVAAFRQLSIISCHDGSTQNLQRLLVARHQYSHVVRVSHLVTQQGTGVRYMSSSNSKKEKCTANLEANSTFPPIHEIWNAVVPATHACVLPAFKIFSYAMQGTLPVGQLKLSWKRKQEVKPELRS